MRPRLRPHCCRALWLKALASSSCSPGDVYRYRYSTACTVDRTSGQRVHPATARTAASSQPASTAPPTPLQRISVGESRIRTRLAVRLLKLSVCCCKSIFLTLPSLSQPLWPNPTTSPHAPPELPGFTIAMAQHLVFPPALYLIHLLPAIAPFVDPTAITNLVRASPPPLHPPNHQPPGSHPPPGGPPIAHPGQCHFLSGTLPLHVDIHRFPRARQYTSHKPAIF